LHIKEAITLIKEITEEKRTKLTGRDIILIPTNPKSTHDVDLNIRTKMDSQSYRCLETIVEQDGYAIKNNVDKGVVTISSCDAEAVPCEETGFR
jgi:hypothetical protein